MAVYRKKEVTQEAVELDLFGVDQRQSIQKVKGLPNPKLHQRISFIKSALRLLACSAGILCSYEIGFYGLLLAEIVGIYEELV